PCRLKRVALSFQVARPSSSPATALSGSLRHSGHWRGGRKARGASRRRAPRARWLSPTRAQPPREGPGAAAQQEGNEPRGMGKTGEDRKSTRLNSSHVKISYAV